MGDKIDAIIREWYSDVEDHRKAAIRDLLTDVRHYCDNNDLSFDDAIEGSYDVYTEESDS